MLLYHFPLTSSSATATIVNKGLKNDYIISGDNNFSSGGKLSAYAKDMGENKFYLSIPNFSLDYTLCFRAKATSNILLLSVGYTPFEITADNTWHDYVICDKKVYKDGLFLTNYNYSAGIVAFGNSEDSCQGLIQDIRIYDYALSQAEINEYSRALVVHYPLQGNELNPSVLKDVSGFGNDMQRYGGSSSYDNNSPRADKSLHLVNANHCYYQGDMKWSDFSNFTISAWIYPTSTSNYRGVIGMHAVIGGVCFAQFVSGNLRFAMITSNNVKVFFYQVGAISTNKWWHVVMSYDGSKGYVYINGELRYSANISSTPNFAHSVVIGKAFESNDRYWDGNISDVRIYATALSAEDIKNLYNSPISVSKQHQTMAFEFVEGNDGFSAKKNGIVQHNELIEGSADGCYNNKLITNKLIER